MFRRNKQIYRAIMSPSFHYHKFWIYNIKCGYEFLAVFWDTHNSYVYNVVHIVVEFFIQIQSGILLWFWTDFSMLFSIKFLIGMLLYVRYFEKSLISSIKYFRTGYLWMLCLITIAYKLWRRIPNFFMNYWH